jgi:hypothetical protein
MRLGRLLVITGLVAAPVLAPVTSFAQSSVDGSNSSSGTDASSGSANGTNSASGQTGLASDGSNNVGTQDTNNVNGDNVQEGNNRTSISQTTSVKTGDVVAGQVIGGVVANGNLVVNATNHSENVDATSGDASGSNTANVVTGLVSTDDAAFVGDAVGNSGANTSELNNVVGRNIQEGDNRATVRQNSNAQSGDGVAGQVIGAVVNGGTTDIAAANTTRDSDITTGDAHADNSVSAFVGLLSAGTSTVGDGLTADINNATGTNVQQGDNRFTGTQNARSTTGDGVAGEVLGVVSAGNTRVDASNITTDSSITTGDSNANNEGAAFVGLLSATSSSVAADLNNVSGTNLQEGDNTGTLRQSAEAVSGDGVAGQVAGIVTSAGGSAAVTLANTSTGIDSTSGDSNFDNSSSLFDGLSDTSGTSTVGEAAEVALSTIFRSALS